MPQISITTNAPLVAKELEDLAAEIPEISRGRIYGRAMAIAKRLRKYPAAPGGSTYRRTYNLRDSVEVVRLDDGYRVIVDPVSPDGRHYGKYVLGNAYGQEQAWMHVGRWPPLRDVTEEELEKLPAEIENEIDVVARRKNLS